MYYQYLGCFVYSHQNEFIVLIDIPLSDLTSKFNVFEVISYDIPFNGSDIVARYEIPHQFLAASPDLSKISFIQPWEFQQCAVGTFQFCKLASAIYYTNTLQDECIVALLLQNSKAPKACTARVRRRSTPATGAIYFGNGLWKVTTPAPLRFSIVCSGEAVGQVQAQPPLSDIQLGIGCYAHCEVLSLPPYFYNDTTISTPALNLNLPMPAEIWAPVHQELAQSIDQIPDQLEQILDGEPTLPILKSKLKMELMRLKALEDGKSPRHSFMFYGMIVVLSVGVILGVIVMVYYCKRHGSPMAMWRGLAKRRTKRDSSKHRPAWGAVFGTDPITDSEAVEIGPTSAAATAEHQPCSMEQVLSAPYLQLSTKYVRPTLEQ